jgi:chemotaxis protein CheX
MATIGAARVSDDKGWLSLLSLSVREVFETMLATKVVPVFEASKKVHLDWTAMVGLTGQLRGIVTFSCDGRTATEIASKMLGTPANEADDRAYDAVGEICNMIAGNFKHKISELKPDSGPSQLAASSVRRFYA